MYVLFENIIATSDFFAINLNVIVISVSTHSIVLYTYSPCTHILWK